MTTESELNVDEILEGIADEDLMEELLLRQAEADPAQAGVLVEATVAGCAGDEQAALRTLEQRREKLIEQALAALQPFLPEALVIFAHDELFERLDSDSDTED